VLKTCSYTQLWSNGLRGRTDQTGTTMGLGDFALFVERIMSSRAAVLIIAQIELRSDLLQVWHRNSRAHWTGMSSWAPGVHGGVVLKSKEWEWNQFLADTWREEGRVKNFWKLTMWKFPPPKSCYTWCHRNLLQLIQSDETIDAVCINLLHGFYPVPHASHMIA
jgi:hypothetical protein